MAGINGTNTVVTVQLAGTGVTLVKGNVYQVSLNVGASPNPATVAVTASYKDATGAAFTPLVNATQLWKSYEAAPNGQPGKVATVGAGNPATVTAIAPGQAVIEAQVASFDSSNSVLTDMVYAQLLVNVAA